MSHKKERIGIIDAGEGDLRRVYGYGFRRRIET